MVLVDTSVWIEFLRCNKVYADPMGTLLEEEKVFTIEPIFGELLQGAKNSQELNVLVEYWENLPKPIHSNPLIQAGIQSSKKGWIKMGVGLIDSAIIIVARDNNLKIWSLDQRLNKLLKKNEKYKID